jgi:hypothetical protein
MATYNLQTGADGYFQKLSAEFTVLQKTVDFAKATGSASGDTGDVLEVISVPANFYVHGVIVKVTTASTTASSVVEVGDATDPNGWLTTSAATMDSTGVKAADGAYVSANGKFYASADSIDITLGATEPENGICEVIVVGFQC